VRVQSQIELRWGASKRKRCEIFSGKTLFVGRLKKLERWEARNTDLKPGTVDEISFEAKGLEGAGVKRKEQPVGKQTSDMTLKKVMLRLKLTSGGGIGSPIGARKRRGAKERGKKHVLSLERRQLVKIVKTPAPQKKTERNWGKKSSLSQRHAQPLRNGREEKRYRDTKAHEKRGVNAEKDATLASKNRRASLD